MQTANSPSQPDSGSDHKFNTPPVILSEEGTKDPENKSEEGKETKAK